MHLSHNEDKNFSLTRFESMLKTNNVLFFDSEEFEEIINYYMENGKIALAKKATKLGLEQHPTSTNLKLFQVEMYIFENKLEVAEEILNELEVIESSNEEIYIQKANIFSRKDDHKKAIELLEIALEITEDEADVLNLLGMEYLFMEDYDNARYYFMKCVEIDPEDYSSLYNIIYCFEYLEMYDEAIDYLNIYLNSNPYCEVAWHQVGKQYFLMKKFDKALAAFDFAIISDDTFVGAYLEKGKVLEKLKRYNEAIENYTITLNLEDPTSFAMLRIGKCHEKLGNDELALDFYQKCVEDDALLDKGWIAITDFYIKKRNFQKALYFIDKAINIDSENVHYWKRYGKINHQLNLFEEAEVGYRRAIELGNYELQTWLSRTDLLLQIGEFDAAVNSILQAMEFYPENAELEYRLAGIYYILSEPVKGKFHLENALKLESDFSMILEILFPSVFDLAEVQNLIEQHRKTSP
jgi:tetratricopeptide (TPR) repeat protein